MNLLYILSSIFCTEEATPQSYWNHQGYMNYSQSTPQAAQQSSANNGSNYGQYYYYSRRRRTTYTQ